MNDTVPAVPEREAVALATFGETMLRYSPAPGERIETADRLSVHVGGAESNVAATAANLGTPAAWLSQLPESALARRVRRELAAHGVRVEAPTVEGGRLGTYYLEPGADPRPANVIYDRGNAAVRSATPRDLPVETVESAEVFATSGITPALSSTLEDTVETLLTRAREAGTTTAFDLNYRSKLWSPGEARETLVELFEAVDVLFVAERDARSVLGREGSATAVAEDLRSDHDFRTVVVTRGEEGAVACTADATVSRSAFDVDTVDPVGAGDAFVGAFLARRLDGDDLGGALAYANATAALARTVTGDVAAITPGDVETVLGGAEGIDR